MSGLPERAWEGLPEALREALGACWSALDASPWDLPPEPLWRAVEASLGAPPVLLRGARLDEARSRRPELAEQLDREGGTLVIPVPRDGASAARARLWRVLEDAPASATPETLAWEQAVPLASVPELAASLRRHGVLAWRSAQSVVPMWMHAHPDDERPLALVEDIEAAIEQRDAEHALRDALEQEIPVADPALSALRAIVLAHDLVTQSDARLERVGLPELCAYAWLDAPSELVPEARSGEPTARAEAWFRWWLAEAVPEAWRAG